MSGKGDTPRPVNQARFAQGWERIFGNQQIKRTMKTTKELFYIIKGSDCDDPSMCEFEAGPFDSLDECEGELSSISQAEKWDDSCQHFLDSMDECAAENSPWSGDYIIVKAVKSAKMWPIPEQKRFEFRGNA